MVCGKPFSVVAALLLIGVSPVVAEDVDGEFARNESISDEASARSAVRTVSSGELLAQLARKSKSWRLRADAAYFISEESVRREIFANDSDWRVKAAALLGMSDGAFLQRVACDESEDGRIRAVAVQKLRDRTVLEKLKSSPNEAVRRYAEKQLPPRFTEAKEAPVPETSFTDINAITRKM